jgi:hypothetical protein
MTLINSAMRAMVEGYTNPGGSDAYKAPPAYAEALASIFGFVLAIVILSFVGMWLWNYSVVPLFEFARPAKSIFQIFGLVLFLTLVSP